MRRGMLLLSVTALAAGPVGAQHAAGTSAAAAQGEDAQGCALCHAAHVKAPGAYSLRGDATTAAARSLIGAARLGPVSQSCLRCHLTAQLRARQVEFAGGAPAALAEGAFLQFDLSDDHPLGSEDRFPLIRVAPPPLDGSWLRPPGPAAGGPTAGIECTTCHDPHRRAGPLAPAEERLLCGRCHDPARYDTRNHAALACSECHALHGGSGGALLKSPTADALCRACHEAGVAAAGASALNAPAPPLARHAGVPGAATPAARCSQCHPPHP